MEEKQQLCRKFIIFSKQNKLHPKKNYQTDVLGIIFNSSYCRAAGFVLGIFKFLLTQLQL